MVRWDGEWWFYGTTSITEILYFTFEHSDKAPCQLTRLVVWISTFERVENVVTRKQTKKILLRTCNSYSICFFQFVMIFILTKWQMPLQQEKDNQLETLQEDCYFIYHLLSGGLEKQDQRRMRHFLVIYSLSLGSIPLTVNYF